MPCRRGSDVREEIKKTNHRPITSQKSQLCSTPRHTATPHRPVTRAALRCVLSSRHPRSHDVRLTETFFKSPPAASASAQAAMSSSSHTIQPFELEVSITRVHLHSLTKQPQLSYHRPPFQWKLKSQWYHEQACRRSIKDPAIIQIIAVVS